MPHVVTNACILCKHAYCVDVCPVDSFREGENFLVIDPDECIDCGSCARECPVGAIYPHDDVPPDMQECIALNASLCKTLPPIGRTRESSPGAGK
ncbi:MAG: ferredoxin family protein [Burkholderiaceae bacterium]|jgi:ferredoxin|nr:ferredoxin family protein [Burkholderiaceae bacterium]